jgi:hypothetical protein
MELDKLVKKTVYVIQCYDPHAFDSSDSVTMCGIFENEKDAEEDVENMKRGNLF